MSPRLRDDHPGYLVVLCDMVNMMVNEFASKLAKRSKEKERKTMIKYHD